MENIIPSRIFEFLIKYPPFSLLSESDLIQISENVIIQYLQPLEIIFSQESDPKPFVYIVQEGAIHLFREENSKSVLVDQCDEGDLFGLQSLLEEQPYLLTARAEEESLVYAIKSDLLKSLIENQPKAAWYIAQNFAVGIQNRINPKLYGRNLQNQPLLEDTFKLVEIQSIEHSKKPVICLPETTIQEAAKIMREHQVGSIIIVNSEFHPIGILTDRDLRNKVVTGEYDLNEKVSTIMSQPVITIPPHRTVADVQIAMMKYGIHHLCLTENGHLDTKVIGIISEHDLLVVQGNNPAIFVREIQRSKNADDLLKIREKAETLLYKYLIQEVSINFISNMMTEVNDALISRILELMELEMEEEGWEKPAVKWCWLTLGSEARKEQLLRTDQDNALVFEDVSEKDYEKTKAYFLTLAKKTTEVLNHCGFEYCPGDMMASNPNWCLSLSEWKSQFTKWIVTPTRKNVMYCSIFFDFRPVYGAFSLGESLTTHIFERLEKESKFLTFLAQDALQNPPPLTFFRNFVVERSGEHKDEFDIKGRAMMPLADAARLLILNEKQPQINNTFHRFDRMAELEPINKEIFEQAADAYEILVRYRALQGLRNGDSGRYINPEDLTKMERLNLRNSFRPIRALQDVLKVRFRLNLLM